MRVRWLPSAELEFAAAIQWYDEQRPGLGERFRLAVWRAVDQIRANPDAAQVFRGEMRRRLVRKYPFCVVYRAKNDELLIAAVIDMRRRPGYWGSSRRDVK